MGGGGSPDLSLLSLIPVLPLSRRRMMEQHDGEMRDLRDVLYAMELRFTEKEAEAEQEFQGMVDDLKNKVSTLEGG